MQSRASRTVDVRLYAIVDPEQSDDCAPLARRVALGGATLVQLRDKHSSTREMISRAREIKAALASARVPFLVNDRVDIALAAGAEGVHLGQDDMPIADARRLLGPSAIIGLSVKTMEEAVAAPFELLDYVAVGGVFATASKTNPGPPIGTDGLAAIVNALRARAPGLPICAIAGINVSNAGKVIGAGADGVSVISALAKAPDPESVARELRKSVDAGLAARGPT